MSALPARRAANVIDLADGIVEGSDWPLVPDGRYDAICIAHEVVELRQFGRAPKLFLKLRLFDAGEHTGRVLFRAYRVRRRIDSRRFVVGRRSELLKMLVRVTGMKTRPDRISLHDLKNCVLSITTRTVSKDSDGHDLPAVMGYSTVADILAKQTIGPHL